MKSPDRYIVLKATQAQKDRTITDPILLYFVFDTVANCWADCSGDQVRWYAEREAPLAYERARELNALDRQLQSEGARGSQFYSIFCCELAAVCMMSRRPIEHTTDCPTHNHRNEPCLEKNLPQNQD